MSLTSTSLWLTYKGEHTVIGKFLGDVQLAVRNSGDHMAMTCH